MERSVYSFDEFGKLIDKPEEAFKIAGDKTLKLIQAQKRGALIPFGFIVSNYAYQEYKKSGFKELPENIWGDIIEHIKTIEQKTSKRYGLNISPILLSVRADSNPALPHMLDTIVNIGLNDVTAIALERLTGNRAYVYSAYCQFILTYSKVVLNIPEEEFEEMFTKFTESRNLASINEFTAVDWIDLNRLYKSIVVRKTGKTIPQDPFDQLLQSVKAVMQKMNSKKVQSYINYNKYSDITFSLIISQMIPGNQSTGACSGVIATHDPITGELANSGDYALDATLHDIIKKCCQTHPIQNLSRQLPDVKNRLFPIFTSIAERFGAPVQIEFVNDGQQLYIIQVQPLVFSYSGLMRSVVLSKDKGKTPKEALSVVQLDDIRSANLPNLAETSEPTFSSGIPSGNGAVVGKAVFCTEECVKRSQAGEKVILFKKSLEPSDFAALSAAAAIVTSHGNLYSASTLLCRMLRKTTAIGCENIKICDKEMTATVDDKVIKKDDVVSVDGNGKIYIGEQPLAAPGISGDAQKVCEWADTVRGDLKVITSAKTAEEVTAAIQNGTEGFTPISLDDVISDVLPEIALELLKDHENEEAIKKLETTITERLQQLLGAANGTPLTIKLLDQPLCVWLPDLAKSVAELARLKVLKESYTAQQSQENSETTETSAAETSAEPKPEEKPEEKSEETESQTSEEPKTESQESTESSEPKLEAAAAAPAPVKVEFTEENEAELNRLTELVEITKKYKESNPLMGVSGIRMNLVTPHLLETSINAILAAYTAASIENASILLPNVTIVNEITKAKEIIDKCQEGKSVAVDIGAELATPRSCLVANELIGVADFITVDYNTLGMILYGMCAADLESFIPQYEKLGIMKDPSKNFDTVAALQLIKQARKAAFEAKPSSQFYVYGDCMNSDVASILCESGVTRIMSKPSDVVLTKFAAALHILNKQ